MSLKADDHRLVFVDVETTGFSTDYDRIIQICVMTDSQHFVTYVNPQRKLDPRAMAVNGITEADVRVAPTFEEISPTVRDLITGKVIVGHNACFDLRFIASELKASAIGMLPLEYICTLSLEKRLLGTGQGNGFYTLPACLERIGVTNERPHDAYHDVLATKRLFEHQVAQLVAGEEVIRRYPSQDRLRQRNATPKVYASLRGFADWGKQSDMATIERFNRFIERALDDGKFSEQELSELATIGIDRAAAQKELAKAVINVFQECIDDGVISLEEYQFIEMCKSTLGLTSKSVYPVFKQLWPTLKITCFDMMPYMNEDGTFFMQEQVGGVDVGTTRLLSETDVFRFALYRGFYPTRNVTKETDLCVNGHPDRRSHTQTRTADKYGIPVVAFDTFASEIEMPVKDFIVTLPEASSVNLE